MPKERVFIDTNVIIESFRVGCWTALCARYPIETVEKCIEEAVTGDHADPRYVQVDSAMLNASLAARHAVTKLDIATLRLEFPQVEGLDDGEQHLLAYLHCHETAGDARVLLSTADKAAVVAAAGIGWLDALVCLETLAQNSGVTRNQVDALRPHHRARWLGDVRVKIGLGIIP